MFILTASAVCDLNEAPKALNSLTLEPESHEVTLQLLLELKKNTREVQRREVKKRRRE